VNKAELEGGLWREGYESRERANQARGASCCSAHDFDARLLVLDGSITPVFGVDRCTYRAGDSRTARAGMMHEESRQTA
jgi:hypothetical protein